MNRTAPASRINQATSSLKPSEGFAARGRRTAIALLNVGALLCMMPAMLFSSSKVYLYNSNGTPVYASTCSLSGQHVYDINSNMIGTLDATNHILNSSSQVIGYVVTQED